MTSDLPSLPDSADAPDSAPPSDRQAVSPEPSEPVYLAVEDWVIDYFLPMFRRTLGGEFRWCAQWWRHGEAISRLTDRPAHHRNLLLGRQRLHNPAKRLQRLR